MNKYLVWGVGNVAERCCEWFTKIEILKDSEILCFISNDGSGGMFHGKPVIAPYEIKHYEFDYICIWTTKYEKEIVKQITEELNIPGNKIADIFKPYKQMLRARHSEPENAEMQDILKKIDETKWLDIYYHECKNSGTLCEVFYDENANLCYIFFEGKRMYLKRSFNNFMEWNGKKYVGDMWWEQDPNSPHLYEEGDVKVAKGDILVDAGACEGNFSLHNIDKVKKAYIIECDEEWMEALQHTFLPYKEKVVFCDKFLSNTDSDKTIRMDTLVEGDVNFIKMDIEGEEYNALDGADRVLRTNSAIKCAVCAYHCHGDEQRIRGLLHKHGFHTMVSRGYMLFLHDPYVQKTPELRRGMVRGIK